MGNRAGLWNESFDTVKDATRLHGRFVGVAAVNGPLPAVGATTPVAAPPGLNRARSLTLTRTGVGLYTLAIVNNPLAAGGNNWTPQFFQSAVVEFMSPTGVKYTHVWTGYSLVAGILSLTLQVQVGNTGTLTDLAATEEIWITFLCSANTVA